jgi:hypothetical protein
MSKRVVDVSTLPTFPSISESIVELYVKGIRKLVLLDFDGVLNCFKMTGTFPKSMYADLKRDRVPNPHYNPNARFNHSITGGYKPPNRNPRTYLIQYAPEMVADLNTVLAREDTALIWVTTWRKHAAIVSELLGVNSYHPATYLPWGTGDDGDNHMNKVKAVGNFLDGARDGMRVAWLDDQILEAKYHDYVNAFIPENMDRLLVAPDDKYGISRAQMRSVHAFMGVEADTAVNE